MECKSFELAVMEASYSLLLAYDPIYQGHDPRGLSVASIDKPVGLWNLFSDNNQYCTEDHRATGFHCLFTSWVSAETLFCDFTWAGHPLRG